MRASRTTFGLFVLVSALLTSKYRGVQDDSPPAAFPVKGRLFIDDQLAPKACIAFFPIDEIKSHGRCAVAATTSDGSFEMTTYAMYDGAPEGDYRVTVIWPDDSMPEDECEGVDLLQHDRLNGEYANPDTTPLFVTVLHQKNYVNLTAQGTSRARRHRSIFTD